MKKTKYIPLNKFWHSLGRVDWATKIVSNMYKHYSLNTKKLKKGK